MHVSRTEVCEVQYFNRHPVHICRHAHPSQGERRGVPAARESEVDRSNMPPSLGTPTRDAKPGARTSWVNGHIREERYHRGRSIFGAFFLLTDY